MQFFEAQRKARKKTFWFVLLFILLALASATLADYILRLLAGQESYNPPFPYFGLLFLSIILLTAGFHYFSFRLYGGKSACLSMGGKEIQEDTVDFQERQLLNVVQEMALAASLPTPQVFVIPCNQINAFAVGLKPSQVAVGVTKGALSAFSREELQAVIGHELGHIRNEDTKISTRLACMVIGFFIIFILGFRLLQGSFYASGSRSSRRGGGQIIALAGLIFLACGLLTWVGGQILRSCVSREREYLADASSVQFTRQTDGLIGALKKIQSQKTHDMPATAMAFSHLYFDDSSFMSKLFATHPPIEKRIQALQKKILVKKI